ncbi:MAG: hypothetical protein HFG82_05590 [Dorea sp.]|jgi:hypothetical protein|nr:hypothetical protein [Dorea sp.]
MQNQKFKKMLAGMLTTTMVFGMGVTAFATDPPTSGTIDGAGDFEGHVEKDIVAVTLPTATATTFAYKMDPEGLIEATEKAKYSDATFEEGKNVFFQSEEKTWTANSAKLKVINKGTVDVDVSVSASTAENANIEMATSSTFAEDNKNAALYLGLKVADETAVAVQAKAAGVDDAEVSVGLCGNADNYQVTSTDNGYEFAAKDNVPDTAWNSFEFGLVDAACNPNGDYSAEDLSASDVTVTWSYVEREADSTAKLLDPNAVSDLAPSIVTSDVTLTRDTPANIVVDLGAGDLKATTVSKVTHPSGRYEYLANGQATYDENSKTITLTAALVNGCISSNVSSINIIFDDADQTSVSVGLTW